MTDSLIVSALCVLAAFFYVFTDLSVWYNLLAFFILSTSAGIIIGIALVFEMYIRFASAAGY